MGRVDSQFGRTRAGVFVLFARLVFGTFFVRHHDLLIARSILVMTPAWHPRLALMVSTSEWFEDEGVPNRLELRVQLRSLDPVPFSSASHPFWTN